MTKNPIIPLLAAQTAALCCLMSACTTEAPPTNSDAGATEASQDTMTTSQPAKTNTALPAIDTAAPTNTQTATFALG